MGSASPLIEYSVYIWQSESFERFLCRKFPVLVFEVGNVCGYAIINAKVNTFTDELLNVIGIHQHEDQNFVVELFLYNVGPGFNGYLLDIVFWFGEQPWKQAGF